MYYFSFFFYFFFFNDTATTEIYTLSLHDALPISPAQILSGLAGSQTMQVRRPPTFVGPTLSHCVVPGADRKSTRLNSSHLVISYAVFCLKKKNKKYTYQIVMILCIHPFSHSILRL